MHYTKKQLFAAGIKNYLVSIKHYLRYSLSKQDPKIFYSVVIPTLQRSQYLGNIVSFLSQNDKVREIIIVNNTTRPLPSKIYGPKIRVIENGKNNFVNPSWNQGVALAQSDYIVLCNDDLIINHDPFPLISRMLQIPKVGIIGCNFILKTERILKTDRNFWCPFPFSNFERRPVGFGCFMAFKKENYHVIPADMKIYFGDDYLIQKNVQQGNFNFAFTLPYFESEMSLTSSEKQFNAFMQTDEEVYLANIR